MKKLSKELLEEWEKYTGITRQLTIIAGRVKKRYRSRIIINGILKTKYYKYDEDARNHYKEELIKQGRTIKRYRMRSKKVS